MSAPTVQQYADADRLLRSHMIATGDSSLALLRCWIEDERRDRLAAEWRERVAAWPSSLIVLPNDDDKHPRRFLLSRQQWFYLGLAAAAALFGLGFVLVVSGAVG